MASGWIFTFFRLQEGRIEHSEKNLFSQEPKVKSCTHDAPPPPSVNIWLYPNRRHRGQFDSFPTSMSNNIGIKYDFPFILTHLAYIANGKKRVILCNNFTGRISVTLLCGICDVSYPTKQRQTVKGRLSAQQT